MIGSPSKARMSSSKLTTNSHAKGWSGLQLNVVSALTLYVFLLMAIPSRLVFAPLGGSGGPATVLAVLFMGWYLIMRLHPDFNVGNDRQPIRTAAVLFFCSVLASFVAANLYPLTGAAQNAVERGIIEATSLVGVLMISADAIMSYALLMRLLGRIVIGASAMASLALCEFVTGINFTNYIEVPGLSTYSVPTDLIVRGGLNRPAATAAHPLELAAVLTMALSIAIHRARFSVGKSRRIRWAQTVVIGAGLIVTLSRTAVIGLVILAVVLLPTWPRVQRRYAYLTLLGSVILIYLIFPKVVNEFTVLLVQLVTGTPSIQSRTNAISAALPFVIQHPWFGTGFGDFFPQIYFYTDDQYLNSLISSGISGLSALIAILASGWFVARALRRRSRDPVVRDLAQTVAAAIAASAGCFACFDVLSFQIASGLTFLLLGCTAALWRLRSNDDQWKPDASRVVGVEMMSQ
jgi:polysaccharide biosynthesis protein PslJ